MPLDAGLEQLRPPEAPYLAETSESEPERLYTAQYRALKICSLPEITLGEQVTLDEAREMIRRETQNYARIAEPGYVLLVKAAPGTGKTTMAVQLAEQVAATGRVLYAGPRHDFFRDVTLLADHPEWWYEWLPRQAGDDEKGVIETCRHARAINTWMSKGYDGIDFCRGVCGFGYVNNGCLWHAQKLTKARIIYGQHQHVWGGHPLAKEFRMVIGDESPLAAFCHEWVIHGQYIIPGQMEITNPPTEIVYELAALADRGENLDGPALLEKLGGARRVREALEDNEIPMDALAVQPDVHNPGDADRAPYFHLPRLLPLLLREARAAEAGRPYPPRVILADKSLYLLLRRRVSEQMPKHMIWLDATANQHLYEAILQRPVMSIEPRVKMKGKIYQVYDRANGKGALTDGKGNLKEVVKDLKKQVSNIAQRYGRIGLITHMAIVAQFEDYPDRGHFYAERGTNRFEDVDALVVAGVPQMPIFEIDKQARMIFFDRMQAFKTADGNVPWSQVDKPYNYVAEDGKGRAWPTSGFWGDPDLQAILWQCREAELIQATHRIRPNLQNKDIWLLENLPVDELPPTRLMALRDLFEAPVGVNVFDWPEMILLADRYRIEGRKLSAQNISDEMGITIQTARRYLKKLLEVRPDEWDIDQAAPKGKQGGRPQQVLKPKTGDKVYAFQPVTNFGHVLNT